MQELSHLSGRCALEPVLHPMMWHHDICVTIACIASRPGAEPLAAVRRRGGALPSASLSHKSRAARRALRSAVLRWVLWWPLWSLMPLGHSLTPPHPADTHTPAALGRLSRPWQSICLSRPWQSNCAASAVQLLPLTRSHRVRCALLARVWPELLSPVVPDLAEGDARLLRWDGVDAEVAGRRNGCRRACRSCQRAGCPHSTRVHILPQASGRCSCPCTTPSMSRCAGTGRGSTHGGRATACCGRACGRGTRSSSCSRPGSGSRACRHAHIACHMCMCMYRAHMLAHPPLSAGRRGAAVGVAGRAPAVLPRGAR